MDNGLFNKVCWRCRDEREPNGPGVLGLCDTHLQERVHDKMLHGNGKPTINGAITRWVEMPASGRTA